MSDTVDDQSSTDQAAFIPAPAAPASPPSPAWPALCERLISEFPNLDASQVLGEVGRARDAAELFGLDAEQRFNSVETMARNNLGLLDGGADLARLDPERHVREQRTS